MERWNGLADVPGDWPGCVATIGVFDGVHRGHRRILDRAAELASGSGMPLVVVTFDPNPVEVIRPGVRLPRLTTLRRRVELLGAAGADAVCVLPFTPEFSRLEPADFVATALAGRLRVSAVVVGENFRFGHKAAGDLGLLTDLGDSHGFRAEGLPLLSADAAGVLSSTLIREALAAGEVAIAAGALGRPHRVDGVVVRGHQRGRELGFPTANLESAPDTAIPADGVYAGWLTRLGLDGAAEERWPAAISVGTNPTFGDGGERTVEAYALDHDDLDLYGWHAGIGFAERIRGTIRFGSVTELVAQMRADVAAARTVTAS